MKIFYLTFFVAIIYGQNSNSIMKATVALNAGMYEKALVHIKEAEKEDPTSPNVYQMKPYFMKLLANQKKRLKHGKVA